MMLPRLLSMLIVTMVAGCAATAPYSLLETGPVTVGTLQVDADAGWNAAAPALLRYQRQGAATWTRDGLLLNRMILIPDIGAGETLFKEPNKTAVYPRFRSDMLPHEVAALVESSLTKIFGEGETLTSSTNLRPATYGGVDGFAFEVALSFSDGPDYRGDVGGFIADGRLNLVIYLGAVPYYYDQHRERAERIIASTRRVAGGG